ncbi:MAG: hypothetical protein LBU82_03695 [Treponema sp.]|nr:hypothetical protein [Treponema sp.]
MKLLKLFLLCARITVCLLVSVSCERLAKEPFELEEAPLLPPPPPKQEAVQAKPLAILQPGKYPLWFQLTENGPALLESIEDALYSAAFVPWPFALHVRFFLERDGELTMVINRDGFLKLAPYHGAVDGLALYRFPFIETMKQYTAGGFVFYEGQPAALFYLDDRFWDSDAPLPRHRTWTFNMESITPFPLGIPALEQYPAKEGWDADILRQGQDGFWYFRVSKKIGPRPEVRILRAPDLSKSGEPVSQGVFQSTTIEKQEFAGILSWPPLPEGFVIPGQVSLVTLFSPLGKSRKILTSAWRDLFY